MFRNNILSKTWNYLTRAHIENISGIREKKIYVLTNRILLISVLFLLLVIATLPSQIRSAGLTVEFKHFIPQISAIILFLVALIINHKSYHTPAKLLIIIGGNAFLWFLSAYFGGNVGSEIYYFVLYFIPLVLFTNKEKIFIFSGMLLSIVLYMSLFLFPEVWTNLTMFQYPEKMQKFAILANALYAFLVTGLIVYSFFHATAEAEDKLEQEKKHSDELLLNILPPEIAERLKSGEKLIADHYESASVIFSDLTGFTKFAAHVEPAYLVGELNRLFSAFDDLAQKFNIEKIKTIGDSYMAVAGLPAELPPSEHAKQAIKMAIEMQKIMLSWKTSNQEDLGLRIGIHSGPLIAGVIGKNKFVYDLWGDTVNIANRLESHGLSGEIQVSREVKELLEGSYSFHKRGVIDLKGLGKTEVYLFQN